MYRFASERKLSDNTKRYPQQVNQNVNERTDSHFIPNMGSSHQCHAQVHRRCLPHTQTAQLAQQGTTTRYSSLHNHQQNTRSCHNSRPLCGPLKSNDMRYEFTRQYDKGRSETKCAGLDCCAAVKSNSSNRYKVSQICSSQILQRSGGLGDNGSHRYPSSQVCSLCSRSGAPKNTIGVAKSKFIHQAVSFRCVSRTCVDKSHDSRNPLVMKVLHLKGSLPSYNCPKEPEVGESRIKDNQVGAFSGLMGEIDSFSLNKECLHCDDEGYSELDKVRDGSEQNESKSSGEKNSKNGCLKGTQSNYHHVGLEYCHSNQNDGSTMKRGKAKDTLREEHFYVDLELEDEKNISINQSASFTRGNLNNLSALSCKINSPAGDENQTNYNISPIGGHKELDKDISGGEANVSDIRINQIQTNILDIQREIKDISHQCEEPLWISSDVSGDGKHYRHKYAHKTGTIGEKSDTLQSGEDKKTVRGDTLSNSDTTARGHSVCLCNMDSGEIYTNPEINSSVSEGHTDDAYLLHLEDAVSEIAEKQHGGDANICLSNPVTPQRHYQLVWVTPSASVDRRQGICQVNIGHQNSDAENNQKRSNPLRINLLKRLHASQEISINLPPCLIPSLFESECDSYSGREYDQNSYDKLFSDTTDFAMGGNVCTNSESERLLDKIPEEDANEDNAGTVLGRYYQTGKPRASNEVYASCIPKEWISECNEACETKDATGSKKTMHVNEIQPRENHTADMSSAPFYSHALGFGSIPLEWDSFL